MGRYGPPKQPTQLALLKGGRSARPSRIGDGGPQPRAAEPEMPAWFDDRHTETWDRITTEVRGMHMLHRADRDALVALVRAIARQEDAARLVMSAGVIVKGKEGQAVRNPAVVVEAHANEVVRRLSREFGLTPSGRADFARPRERDDDLDRLLT